MKKIIYSLFAVAMLTFSACSDVKYEDAIVSKPCSALNWSNDGRKLTLTWTLPEGATGAVIYKDNIKVVALNDGECEYTIKRADTNVENLYTVKAVYPDGRMSEGISTKVFIEYEVNTKAGFLLLADSYDQLTDDDELAAAAWFKENYVDKGKGEFITADKMGTLSADQVSCLMILIDRVGMPVGYENMPADVLALLPQLKAYVQDDGNLFLVNHATQLVEAIGRTKHRITCYGNGGGSENSDEWNIQSVIGNKEGEIYDRRGHALFRGVSTTTQDDHEVFHCIGAGVKEDHNCLWDLSALEDLQENPNKVADFERINDCTVLGAWGQICDYSNAGIVEFNPTKEYTGRIIAIGLGAYEFNQPGGNAYDADVKRIAANAIEYLQ